MLNQRDREQHRYAGKAAAALSGRFNGAAGQAQRPVFSFQLLDTLANQCQGICQLRLGEARRNMLLAVPVEGLQMENKARSGFAL